MEQVVGLSEAMPEGLSLEEQLAHVLEAARQAAPVDRLHLWALAPGGDRLVYVAGSGVSEEDRRQLHLRPEVPVAHAGALARAVREKTALLVNGSDSRLPRLRVAWKALESTSFFVVPLLARGDPLGVLVADNKYTGAALLPASLRLLPVFARHLATAVDNARLLSQLHACERSLKESIEQQASTSSILRVISSSPTDLQPVLDAVAESAARLCDASDAVMLRVEGDTLKPVAQYGSLPTPSANERLPIRHDLVVGRAVIERQVMHIPDLGAVPEEEFAGARALHARFGYRTLLVVPMLREQAAVGVIAIRRMEVRPFSDKQVSLLKTFADQAVIAIENARLVAELQRRNQDLTEALEQQTATSEILRVISSSPTDLQPVLRTLAESASRLCNANDATIFRIDGESLHTVAHFGSIAIVPPAEPIPIRRDLVTGRAVLEGRVLHIADVLAEPDSEFAGSKALAARLGYRTFLAVPMLREGKPIGVIGLRRVEAQRFSDQQIALLETFADQAVIAIENTRLFNELASRNRDLTESLEQQTATSEILRVISSSPTDLEPVLDAVVRSAARLCEASDAVMFRIEGECLQAVKQLGSLPPVPGGGRLPIRRDLISGRAILDRRTVRIADALAEPESEFAAGREVALRMGYRTVVVAPMMREGEPVGAIGVWRREVRPFSDTQIALLQTFADQAVIAIENTRLFNELQSRNRDLTESLEQQTATADILRVISQAQRDVMPVFEAIGSSALKLCRAASGGVFTFDGELIHLVTGPGLSADALAAARRTYPMPPGRGGATARAILTRAVAYVPDVEADPEFRIYSSVRASQHRCVVSVPMLRDGNPIGAITVGSAEPAAFSDRQIALLNTFADQAVIAIENTRLFNALESRNRDLTEALEQQTATSEILRVISSSPTDLQPVLDTITETAARLLGARDAVTYRVEGERLEVVAQYGSIVTIPGGGQSLPIRRDLPSGRAVIDRDIVHVPDVLAASDAEFATGKELARRIGFHTVLVAPLLRKGVAIGTIAIRRAEVAPFTEKQIELLKTFADQAVIAIENVRLFTELQERLEQQTATSEILRVISQSQRDVQPVFEAIAANALKLCRGKSVAVLTFDGELLKVAAAHSVSPEVLDALHRIYPMAVGRGGTTGRAILTRAVVSVADVREDPDYELHDLVRVAGYRSVVSVPLLRDGKPIGAITIVGAEPGMFSARQISMLQTFADQGVIAVENTRLFNELESRNRDLTETLEQQTATSDILRVISQSQRDVQPVFEAIASNARNLCEATFGGVFTFDDELIHFAAAEGFDAESVNEIKRWYPMPPGAGGAAARTVLTRAVVRIQDIREDSEYGMHDLAHALGFRSALAVPMLRDGSPIGAISLLGAEPAMFTERQIGMLQTFADQAVIAIENTRLFNELETRNRDLSEALEQQTATSEILRVISQSQADVQPVFETIAASAQKLCEAQIGAALTFDGELINVAALHSMTSEGLEATHRVFPMPPSRGGAAARAILTRGVVYIPDVHQDAEFHLQSLAQALGLRSALAVPMLRDGSPIGAISVTGAEPAMFSERQIAMLQTFADQAVIAIENTRLFKELQARTAELGRSVEELKALGEVGSAVSSTLDLDTVLTTILTHANQLAGTQAGQIFDYDEATEELSPRATFGYTDEIAEALRTNPIRKGEGVAGQAVAKRQPVQVADIFVEGAYDSRLRQVIMASGFRALLAVPLIREDEVIGALAIARKQRGEFPPQVVDLLTTFASQSALAMQNARLFHQLEIASQHKSTFLANMSHELRTPLNAIIGYSEMLQEDAVDEGAESLVPDLKRVNAAGKHLLELINSILDLSKIEAGKMELQLEEFSVARVVEDIGAVVKPLAEKNGNRLELVCDPAAGTMHADLTKVRQVLFNLLSNACKFTERGTVSLAVCREESEGDAWLTFSVSDTGIGLSAEQLGRLFQEFAQAHADATRKYGGTGLGLALSRRLCRLMGGDISVTSEPGKGSTFTVRLPADVERIHEVTGRAAGSAGTVLVIDDEAVVRELMQRFLAKEGFRVVTATSGEEGLRLAREQRPDAVTLDVMMPGMDGWAVLCALTTDPELADIPVIMLTIVDDKKTGYALGASEYLTKPIDRARLVAVLTKYRRDMPVLVVDDDAGIRQLLRRILEEEGYAVIEADNGRVALERLGERVPGTILLDLMMPEMDGFEFLDALHGREAWRHIPVVIVTAKDLTREEHDRLNGSVVRILQKGAYAQEELLAEVRALVAASIGRRKGRSG